jgi:hypothetical protein
MASSNASGAPAILSQGETAVAKPHERVPIKALEDSINEIKYDVKDVKAHRLIDFLWHAGALIAFGTFVIALYFWLDDKVSAISTTSARLETKLEDLLERLPPVPTPPQR